jgi:hypothetical protein
MEDEPSLQKILDSVTSYASRYHPDDVPLEVRVPFQSGREIVLLVQRTMAHRDSCSHSPDFRSIVWYGWRYDGPDGFTSMQALVIRALWEARQTDTPDVETKALAKAANTAASTFRVKDLFRGHKILADGVLHDVRRGVWRLRTPDEIE